MSIKIICFVWMEKIKKPSATKKNLNANAANGSELSIMGFVVTKAEDQRIMKINGKILVIIDL